MQYLAILPGLEGNPKIGVFETRAKAYHFLVEEIQRWERHIESQKRFGRSNFGPPPKGFVFMLGEPIEVVKDGSTLLIL